MARIFTEGFELRDGVFFDLLGGAINTTTKRSGGASWYIVNGTAKKNVSDASEIYIRVGFNCLNSSTTYIFRWYKNSTELGSIRWNSVSGKMAIYTGASTLVANGNIVIGLTTWYLLEAHIKISDTIGVIEVKIDGMTDATFSGDTKPGADTDINTFWYSVTGGVYYDDLAYNDTTGESDNSWCGDGKIIALTPNANGDLSQLVGSDLNSIDNYLLVDEYPHDTDTTYVEGSNVDEKDLYNLAACGLSGVTITRVWGESRTKDTVAADGLVAIVLKTNSTEYPSSDITLLTSYTKQILGTVHSVNPNTAVAWSTGDLDALQVGVKTRS